MLAPFRRSDAREIAEQEGIGDADTFLGEVSKRGAGPLAAKPVTLKLLINLYRQGGRLPKSQAELYEAGCLALCDESNLRRREATTKGWLDPQQRLAVAARIAAMTVFCGRGGIWLNPDLGDRPYGDLSVSALGGGTESDGSGEFDVSEGGIREVLTETGLFSRRGGGRVFWNHRTYAEFLAARYVTRHELTVGQTTDLIMHPGMPGRVVPQLRDTAAWLAGMRPGIFDAILATDPEVLLRSEVGSGTASEREALVTALLGAAEAGRISDVAMNRRSMYHNLVHPQLTEQVRPYIIENSKGLVVRRMAIDLTEACKLIEVQEELAVIALDRSEPLDVRVKAAYAVWRIGDESAKKRLRGLLETDLAEDIHDNLRGCALRSLWPDLITVEEVFAHLTRRKRENYSGAYSGFMHHELVSNLAPEAIPTALRWIAEQGVLHRLPYSLRLLSDQILIKAWDHLESPEVLERLADVVWSRLTKYEFILDSPFLRDQDRRFGVDDGRRRQLLAVLLSKMAVDDSKRWMVLSHSTPPLLMPSDIPWLVDRLDCEPESAGRIAIGKLLREALLNFNAANLDLVLDASRQHPELDDLIRYLVTPIAFNSPEAEQQKAGYWSAQPSPTQTEAELVTPPHEQVEHFLWRAETGELNA
ncbi:NACHT domain-containing protein [Singulisphaera acidiphila]|uniref:NACHT domain-containing protein n=1 Tax=Singulisphaera acidiphila TaxID=466153 RepID=UPI00024711C6|nr:hypothetical protein [Singulisphaera acidiphila]